ncbi:MAG: hypothetical protein ABJK28_13650 [Algibacter sp.]
MKLGLSNFEDLPVMEKGDDDYILIASASFIFDISGRVNIL